MNYQDEQFKKLKERTVNWGKSKGILDSSTPTKQAKKTQEELMELFETLTAQRNNMQFYINSKGVRVNTQEQLIDDYGDLFVTLILGAEMQHIDLLSCWETVLNVIEKRTGKMINGTFVKETL